jgi:threonylcarbamoyladenosine tRNA methylthiotransferase MtaB
VPKAAFVTLGCRVNQYESERIRETLEARGFETGAGADLVVVNTCAVTSHAEAKSRAAIRRARRDHPGALVAVTGCAAQRALNLGEEFEGADLAVPNGGKLELWRHVAAMRPEWAAAPCATRPPALRRTRAILKVQDGCDVACSFCAIHTSRPAPVSRPAGEVVEEARRWIAAGAREIVLAGILLGAYGPGTGSGGPLLEDLIERLAALPGLARLRLSSIEPWHVTPRLAGLLRDGAVVPWLHLPLQSGDDGVLAAMGRPYRAAEVLGLAEELYERVTDFTLSLDVMTGFPIETEEAFENTLRACRLLRPYRVHAFPFSPRPGTPAARMGDPVPAEEKARRRDAVSSLAAESGAAHAAGFVGKVRRALLEGGRTVEGLCRGSLDCGVEVVAPGPGAMARSLVWLRVAGAAGATVRGEAVRSPDGADGPWRERPGAGILSHRQPS